ncbi:DUF1801 domain-containing protein [Fibrisoma montanum]|uniref:DUF1801 domain-containing protein n=1 Tax=Fibrisoma montanum TaxID=2305895 RepID=A0A418M2G1_9BACT|nr:DUF1801 domain-containing protein [Fibrisoma montanum]RIV19878.1 DUF1801 domain-containing protein [Fibrisoma montanum]
MTVDDYIVNQLPACQVLLRRLRQLILNAAPGVTEKISWNVPFYTYRNQYVCYFNVLRNGESIDVAFLRGTELPDEAGRLDDRGRKTIKSLVVRSLTDADEDLFLTYLHEALLLNETQPQKPVTSRKKRT